MDLREVPEATEVADQQAEMIMQHIFRCRCCGKFRNRNRQKKIVGVHVWKSSTVCSFCFEKLGLEVA